MASHRFAGGGDRPGVTSAWDDGYPVHFPANAVIFEEGDRPDLLYQIVEGKVKLGRGSTHGRRCLVHLLGPTDVFGEDGVLDGGPRTATAVAATPVHAISLSRSQLDVRLGSDPAAVDFLLRVIARRVRRTSDTITDLMSATVSARVAKHLLRLAQQFGTQEDGAVRVALDLTQEQFAQLVGTSRESLNKALADFVEHGWIRLDGDTVAILDSHPLAQRMDGARRLNVPYRCRTHPVSAD